MITTGLWTLCMRKCTYAWPFCLISLLIDRMFHVVFITSLHFLLDGFIWVFIADNGFKKFVTWLWVLPLWWNFHGNLRVTIVLRNARNAFWRWSRQRKRCSMSWLKMIILWLVFKYVISRLTDKSFYGLNKDLFSSSYIMSGALGWQLATVAHGSWNEDSFGNFVERCEVSQVAVVGGGLCSYRMRDDFAFFVHQTPGGCSSGPGNCLAIMM